MREAQELKAAPGRSKRFVYFMRCDHCKAISPPAWEQQPLEFYRLLGWKCDTNGGSEHYRTHGYVDLCPECGQKKGEAHG